MRTSLRHTLVLTAALAIAIGSSVPAPAAGNSDAPDGEGEVVAPRRGCDARVSSGKALRRAINRRPQGATICLSGTIRIKAELEPKHRQVFVGPAALRPTHGRVEQGFDLDKASGVVIRRLNVSGFALRAIRCGRKALITRSRLHHNGRNGIGGGNCAGLRIVRNEIDHNGDAHHLGSGSSGVKLAGDADHTTVIRNYVHHNIGNGLWWDADARDALASRNRIIGNTRKGINYEVSGGPAIFRHNVVRRNNREGHRDSAGIMVTSSRDVRIVYNILGRNRNAGVKIDNAGGRGFPLEDIFVAHNRLRGDEIRCDEGRNIRCQRR
jgi:hypothetical protein